MIKSKKAIISVAAAGALIAGSVSPAYAAGGNLTSPCIQANGCVNGQTPAGFPQLTDEEQKLMQQCNLQLIAAGAGGLAGKTAWAVIGGTAAGIAAGIGPCNDAGEKYRERTGG